MSEGGNESRKQVGTLFLELQELRENVKEANEQLKSVGHGVDLNMGDVMKKQIQEALNGLINEVKKTTKKTQDSTKEMGDSIKGVSTDIEVLGKATQTWSGKQLEHITRVEKGWDKHGKAMRKVMKDGQTVSVTKVDSDPVAIANKLYQERIRLFEKLKKAYADMQKYDVGTIGYRDAERKAAAAEIAIKKNKEQAAKLPIEIQENTKLNTLLEKQAKLRIEIAEMINKAKQKKTDAEQTERAAKLYDEQIKDLQEIVSLTQKYYASIGTGEEEELAELINILNGVINLRKEEIAQIDQKYLKTAQLAKLNKEYEATEKGVAKAGTDYADGLAEEQIQNYEDLAVAYEKYVNAKDDEERERYGQGIDVITKEIELKQKQIDLVDDETAANSKLVLLERERMDLAKKMSQIEANAQKGQESEQKNAQKRHIDLLKERLQIEKKLSGLADGEQADDETKTAYFRNRKELKSIEELIAALEKEGEVKQRNIAYDMQRRTQTEQISGVQNKPSVTDAQADAMAAQQLKNYKQLYEQEAKIASTKNEDLIAAYQKQHENAEKAIRDQQEKIDKVEEEIRLRTKLATLDDDIGALRAESDAKKDNQPLLDAQAAEKAIISKNKENNKVNLERVIVTRNECMMMFVANGSQVRILSIAKATAKC